MNKEKKPKLKTFFYHYNKPKSLQLKKVIWSTHFDKQCHFVTDIVLNNITAFTKVNKTQPVAVIKGYYNEIIIRDETAIVF